MASYRRFGCMFSHSRSFSKPRNGDLPRSAIGFYTVASNYLKAVTTVASGKVDLSDYGLDWAEKIDKPTTRFNLDQALLNHLPRRSGKLSFSPHRV